MFLFCFSGFVRSAEVFAQAVEPRTLVFPRDHASHAGFLIEWWYFTGNLSDAGGREFGYQLTIFRRAMSPLTAAERGRTSRWAVNDMFVGHLAISDIADKHFYFSEDVQRDSLDLAGATGADAVSASNPPRVWMGNWKILNAAKGWTLSAADGGTTLDLELSETMPPVPNGKPGEEGLSRKGPNPGQASYYYSVAQLKTNGTIGVEGKKFSVGGISWMDHEFGSNQLDAVQRGWEWFSIQFDDGSALMLYLLRREDGSVEPNSSGTWIASDGKHSHVTLDDLKVARGRKWTSTFSKHDYTLGWHIDVPRLNLSFDVDAAQDDQEVKSKLAIVYYEGAIHVKGARDGKAVSGKGYLEITLK